VYKSYIKEQDWQKIYQVLKEEKGIRAGSVCKTRRFIEGVYCIMRTRAQRRELPDACRVFSRFDKKAVCFLKY
jgi:hypothetical protein